MSTEKMFTIILDRLDTMETNLNAKIDSLGVRMDKLESRIESLESRVESLESRMDKLEAKVDKMEADMNMEFQAVRTEMEVIYKSLKKEIYVLNEKVDRLWFTKDVEGYDKINIRLEVLECGYQELKEKIV